MLPPWEWSPQKTPGSGILYPQLAQSHRMLTLLIWGLCLENHCVRAIDFIDFIVEDNETSLYSWVWSDDGIWPSG